MKLFATLAMLFSVAIPVLGQNFIEQVIDDSLEIGYGVALADVNGDGATDILLADKRLFVWYENPTWKKHIMVENLTAKDHVCIAARDIDGDGKCEVAVGAEWNPSDTENSGSVHYLLPPPNRTERWEAIPLHREPTVHRMRWVRGPTGTYSLIVAPLHGRANKNGQGAGVRVLAYEMPQNPRAEWKTTLVHDTMHLTHNFEVISTPAGEPEHLLLGGREGVVRLAPLEGGWQQQWITRHPADSKDLLGVGEVRWGVLGNGRPYVATIEPMHGTQLCLYVPPADGPKDKEWQRSVLDDTLVDAHALACYDLLGLGNRQITVGWRAQNKVGVKVGVKLFQTSKEDGSGWQSSFVDDNGMACEDLATADLDGDRDHEIVAAGRRTKNLKIYWNQR